MKDYIRKTAYRRDDLDKGGRQFILPWSAGKSISAPQAAKRLNVCADTVRCMLEEGVIQGWRIRPNKPHSPWRVSVESVEMYIDKLLAHYDTSGSDANQSAGRAGRAGAASSISPRSS